MSDKRKQTVEIMSIIGGVATVLALTLAPMFYLGAKIDNIQVNMQANMNEFRQEMKEFHGRLCKLEERSRK